MSEKTSRGANIVVGGQWGDEGKGKVIAYLALKDNYNIIARAGVGPNAGHTVELEGKKFGVRLVPSGFVNKSSKLYIGAGVLINPQVLLKEIEETKTAERIKIDRRCGIIEERHIEQDKSSRHLHEEIGSTGSGCGPANIERVNRKLKLAHEIPALKNYVCDAAHEINAAFSRGEKILVEGTQGFGLSLYYGTYPYVTSKDTTASTALADIGLGPKKAGEVIIVFKSYPSRVGAGPFPTELLQEEAEKLGIVEFGTVTGRRRRTGIFDFEMAKYAAMVNSATQIAITCIDYIDKMSFGVKEYKKLGEKSKKFIQKVEQELGIPVTLISTGPKTDEIIDLREEKV